MKKHIQKYLLVLVSKQLAMKEIKYYLYILLSFSFCLYSNAQMTTEKNILQQYKLNENIKNDYINDIINKINEDKHNRDKIIMSLPYKKAKLITYVIKKGDTWKSIAKEYGISEEYLRSVNTYFDNTYVGLQINIPTTLSVTELEEINLKSHNALFSKAQQKLENGNYKQAIEIYNKIISFGHAPLIVYYNRGHAYYKRGKLKKSLEDFNYILQNDHEKEFSDISELCSTINKELSQRRQQRAQTWSELIGFGLQITNTVIQAKENEKHTKIYSNNHSISNDKELYNNENIEENTDSNIYNKTKGKCGTCGGKGYIVKYTAGFGLSTQEYCEECGKNMSSTHYHHKCPSCDGSGIR